MRTEITARVIADSVAYDSRLTTLELEYPRFVLPELNTHRVFSRNTASSRAIPTAKLIDRVRNDPAIPIEWGENRAGMQAVREVDDESKRLALAEWIDAAYAAASYAMWLDDLGVHRQITNRVLEPYMWARTIVSSTEWDNFFDLRISPLAQPEMRKLAERMKEARDLSTPVELRVGQWHTPYATEEDQPYMLKVSAARCARVSYLTHDGKRDVQKDVELFDRLVRDRHLSPLEHVATPEHRPDGNFLGWGQLRHMV